MGGKGKRGGGSPWKIREIGTFAYLKNFRKGLLYQLKRCTSDLEAATVRSDAAEAFESQHRLFWIQAKQQYLDVQHEMIFDKPSWQNGRELEYGSMQ